MLANSNILLQDAVTIMLQYLTRLGRQKEKQKYTHILAIYCMLYFRALAHVTILSFLGNIFV